MNFTYLPTTGRRNNVCFYFSTYQFHINSQYILYNFTLCSIVLIILHIPLFFHASTTQILHQFIFRIRRIHTIKQFNKQLLRHGLSWKFMRIKDTFILRLSLFVQMDIQKYFYGYGFLVSYKNVLVNHIGPTHFMFCSTCVFNKSMFVNNLIYRKRTRRASLSLPTNRHSRKI